MRMSFLSRSFSLSLSLVTQSSCERRGGPYREPVEVAASPDNVISATSGHPKSTLALSWVCSLRCASPLPSSSSGGPAMATTVVTATAMAQSALPCASAFTNSSSASSSACVARVAVRSPVARLPASSLLGCALPVSRWQVPGLPGLSQVLQAKGSGIVASAASAEAATNEDSILEFAKNDNRRMLHVVYRVGDLDKTIKFYTECLGMKLLRRRDIPEEKYTNAFLGYGPEEDNFVVELTYNYGVDKYDIGTGFGHFGIAVEDVQRVVDIVKAKHGKVTREPGPVKGGKTIIAFVEDPDGYKFELIQRPRTPEPFCQVMLRVGDLDRAVQFYEKAFGMKELRRIDIPEQKYTLAMVGYGDDEMKTTVLELTYNYGVTEYTKGNGYGQIALGTDDVYKTAEAVKTFGGKIVREPGPLPIINTKITAVLDPDGWKSVFVDNIDFAKELE